MDTLYMDGMSLYRVESYPYPTGIQYFYYENKKVYNYDIHRKILQLLYDFNKDVDYNTNYRPICDPYFDYDSLDFNSYTIRIDSLDMFDMPDGTIRSIQYCTPIDTIVEHNDTMVINDLRRSIVSGIGFMQGGLHLTHDWELGAYICDELENFVFDLRCFEDDEHSYNFVGIPCDSSWIVSSTDDFDLSATVSLYPNPTTDYVTISKLTQPYDFILRNGLGNIVQKGQINNNDVLKLESPGLYLLELKSKDHNMLKQLWKID